MTNFPAPANSGFAFGTAKLPRTVDTFPPELVERARKIAIGGRIKFARERSRYRQQQVADHLDIGLRAYQKLEKEGTSSFERCEELAEFLDVEGVTADYLWDGTETTPDLMAVLSAPASAEEIVRRLVALEEAIEKMLANQVEILAGLDDLRKSQAS